MAHGLLLNRTTTASRLPSLPPVDTKKGRGAQPTLPARGTVPRNFQVLSSSAPARVRTSCRGRLLSTFHQVDKQSHDDAGHNLRGYVQQELLHLGILLYRRTAPEPF